MKKLSGLLAVSLIAIMMAPAARADIASTGYVDTKDDAISDAMEVKANKVTNTSSYDEDSKEQYPSMAVANQMAKKAAAQNAAGKLDKVFQNNKNQVMITTATGAVTPTTVDTDGEGNAVTAVTVAGGKYTVTKGETFATKAQLDTVQTTADNTASAVNNATTGLAATKAIADKNKTDIASMDTAYKAADTAINNKIGTVTAGKTVVQMIEEAKTSATYDDTAIKADIKKNADAITTINNSDVMNSGANKTKIDAIAANTTAAANAKSAADAAQATANGLKTSKQDTLVATGDGANIAGDDGVSVSIDSASGKITVKGNQAAIDTALAGKQASLSTTQMAAVNSGVTAAKVASYEAAVTTANAALPKATYDSQVGTVSAANMGTTATTVVGAIKEIKDAVSTADGAAVKADQGTTNKDKAVITDANGKVTTGQIATGMIATGAVTADKIGANAVTSAKIADGTIVNADISASAAIAQSKISGLTDALAAKFVAPAESATSTDGTYTLTMKVVNSVPTYTWEKIGR